VWPLAVRKTYKSRSEQQHAKHIPVKKIMQAHPLLAPTDQGEHMAHTLTRIRSARLVLSAAVVLTLAFLIGSCTSRQPEVAPPPPPPAPEVAAPAPTPGKTRTFTATAYSIEGTTKSGGQAHEGIVAADPRVLPIGTRIRVADAGQYSGVYTVTDTGRAIKGTEIDIYLASDKEAKHFGRKQVQVEVLGKD
jgi:3D (Asp-Asp-Asp) domain-containing protein